mgnify:FL=1
MELIFLKAVVTQLLFFIQVACQFVWHLYFQCTKKVLEIVFFRVHEDIEYKIS